MKFPKIKLAVLLLFAGLLYSQNMQHLNVEQFKAMAKDSTVVLVDLRTDAEVARGIIADAIQIDYYAENFDTRIAALDTSVSYLLYCRSGGRSGQALLKFVEAGINNVCHLQSGINGWHGAGEIVVLPASE